MSRRQMPRKEEQVADSLKESPVRWKRAVRETTEHGPGAAMVKQMGYIPFLEVAIDGCTRYRANEI